MRKLITFAFLLLISQIGIGQLKTFTFPFQTGDLWQYYVYLGDPALSFYTSIQIDHDTLMPNNKVYKVFSSGLTPFFYFRQDSTRIFQYSTQDSTEFLRYDFSRNAGDTISIVHSGGLVYPIVLTVDQNVPVFNQQRRIITFHSSNGLISDQVVDSIGIFDFVNNIESDYRLTGAIVGGKSYGTILDVKKGVVSMPNSFSLYQNYPNPFNPTTTISFALPSQSVVSLKVFDMLGREVSTIVSGELQAGTYTRQWNASAFASGVYFYRLQAGTFNETKKLLLLK